MKFKNKKGFTLVEIMAATAIMTIIVLIVLSITSQVLNTWNRASGQLQTYFEANNLASVIQEDLESMKIKKDGRAWLEVRYPENVGLMTGTEYLDSLPMRPPEIMFYAPTLLRPRYTREHMSDAISDNPSGIVSIPGSICAIKYQVSLKSPFMLAAASNAENETQYDAFYGFYRAVIDPKSTATEGMGMMLQGYSSSMDSEDFLYALSTNLWEKTCTVIDESGEYQPGANLKTWALAPENMLVMNVVDFRITFGVMYPNEEAEGDPEAEPYKLAYIPPGVGFTVGPRILFHDQGKYAYEYSDGGGTTPVDPRLLENGFLSFAEISMTIISEKGAKEMKALMKNSTLSQEKFKELILEYGNTITRRIQFLAEPM